jgi:hypothetical protein
MSPQGAMPQAAQPQQEQEPAWMTPRRKKMYEKAKQAYGAYQSAVDQRRKMRKQSREYSSLYNQMKNEQGKADQLENMMTNYKDIFRPEDPRTMQAIRQQMQHFETAERLRGDLHKRLQKSGIKSPQRVNARFNTVRVRVPAGSSWTYMRGVEVNGRTGGLR